MAASRKNLTLPVVAGMSRSMYTELALARDEPSSTVAAARLALRDTFNCCVLPGTAGAVVKSDVYALAIVLPEASPTIDGIVRRY